MLPTSSSGTDRATPSSTIFGNAMVRMLNTSPALIAITRNEPEQHDSELRGQRHLRLRHPRLGMMAVVRHQPEIDDAGDDAEHCRRQERAAPAEPARQSRGDAGSQRNAEIAADAVEGERSSARCRRPRSASPCRPDDRSRQTCRARTARPRAQNKFGAKRRGRQRKPAAEIERRHHIAAAPAVGEPAGRQRKDAEGEERRAGERDQLAIGPAGR